MTKKSIFSKALSFCVLLFTTSLLNASTYTVTSTANGTNTDGVSLRWAITQANTGVGNTIAFNIPGMAPHTITLTSALPVLSKDNITIDGSTQPANGYTGASPKIIINGNNAISKGIEASPTKDDMKIYGLYIKGFTDHAIYFPGKETHIIGAVGKGNVISGNGNASTDAAIYVKGATIKANIIGLDVTGTTAEANTGYGIQASGGVCIIGGANAGEGNVISANTNHGIYFTNCDNSIIKGNKIGTDINGANDLGNGGNGIYITVNSNNVEIGGTTEAEGNVISGNTLSGINNDGGNDLIVKGNKIGTDITGTLNIGNTGNGITLTSTATMGTIEANVISGNADGIYISGADNGIIKNNKIGTDITGTQSISNTDYGIFITNNADSHQIGGTGANEGNIIAYNGNSGVGIDANGGILTDNNKIQRNSIFCNASTGNTLGIALINNGNDGIAAPVITTANATTISGTSVANATIEIFKDNDNCSGCQGKTFLGSTTANGSGDWSFAGNFCGESITATAYIATKGTSQFASCVSLPQLFVNAGTDQTITLGNSVAIGGSPTVSGGVTPYTYSWNPATGLNSVTVSNPNANPTTNTIYTITVTDSKGCSASDTTVVMVGLVADAGLDKTIVNGVSVVIGGSPAAAGGLPPYTYLWSPSIGLNSATIANPTASERSIRTYTLTITDANNNTAIDFVVVDTLYNFCSFDDVFTKLKQEPGYIAANDAQEEAVLDYIAQRAQATTYTIPVVVHVLHNGEPLGTGGNISYEQIQSQINALNAAFQRDYALYNQQGHGPRAANADISFCLATIPAGPASFFINPSTGEEECGVMRYNASSAPNALDPGDQSDADAAAIRSFTHPTAAFFPFDDYLNVWTVRNINGTATPGVVGYAYPPPPGTPTMDGVVMRSDCFGDNTIQGNNFPLLAMFDQGKIFAHEVGHYLGLLHTHEGPICASGNDAICNITGDRVCDTPPCFARNWICPGNTALPNTCNETTTVLGGDGPDQIENYLSISDDGCMNTFTTGQAVRMDGFLNVNIFRQMWLNPNLIATGVVKTVDEICPCCELSANILFTPETPCPGESVNFITPTGSGYCATTWAWTFDGGTPANSTVHNPTGIQFNIPGTYIVTLTASDGPRTASSTVAVTVTVPTAQIISQSVNTNVCNGSLQDIIVVFTGTPPYAITITGNGGAIFNFNNITANPATVTVLVDPTNTSFTISAMSNASCNGTFSGTADFTLVECCTELAVNGDFEDFVCPNTNPINPATTQQTLNCSVYQPGNYAIKNFTTTPTAHGDWPQLSLLPNRGNSMFIDGQTSPITTSPNQAEIWCENMVIRPFTNYIVTFYTSGGTNGLTLQVKLNGSLVGNTIPINVVNFNNWGQYSVIWNSGNIVAGTYPVCLSQVINFNSDGFDYLIDDISFRPIVEIDAGADVVICAGTSVQLNATPGKAVYSWSPTTGLNNPNIADPIATPAVTTNYTVTSTDAYGCTASDQVTVFVDDISVNTGADVSICLGNCTDLFATGNGGVQPYTFVWSSGQVIAGPVNVCPVVTTTYTVIITGANGCTVTDDVVVTVNPIPMVDAGSDLTVCPGSPRLIGVACTPCLPNISYTWSPSVGLTDANISNPAADPAATTTYTLTVTDIFTGCTATDEVIVYRYRTDCAPRCSSLEDKDPMNSPIPGNCDLSFRDIFHENFPGVLYQWSIGTSGGVLGCPTCSTTTAEVGNYNLASVLSYVDANGNSRTCPVLCNDYWTVQCADCLGIPPGIVAQDPNTNKVGSIYTEVNSILLEGDFESKLYPNPNNGNMLLDYTINKDDIGLIRICDLTGKLITNYELNANARQLQINNVDLQNGIYIYYIIVNNRTVKTNKLVIIK